MPSHWSDHNSPSTDSSRIITVGRGWGEREWKVTTGLLKVITTVVDYGVSSPPLFLAGGQRATACMLISCGREKGEGTAGQDRVACGPREEKPPDPAAAGAAQTPLTLPLNRWRQEGLVWAEWYDWSPRCVSVSSLCLRSHHSLLTCGCFRIRKDPHVSRQCNRSVKTQSSTLLMMSYSMCLWILNVF